MDNKISSQLRPNTSTIKPQVESEEKTTLLAPKPDSMHTLPASTDSTPMQGRSITDGLMPVEVPFWEKDSGIETDPKITFGVLDNGMKYAILPHHNNDQTKTTFRLHVDVGSLAEEEDEQGIAHAIEHMAFQGSEHYPNGELVKTLESDGISFGADNNAHTSQEETVYKLDIPNDQGIEKPLNILYDYAKTLTFPENKIASEMKVVLQEKKARKSPGSRASKAIIDFIFENTRIPMRPPIGKNACIKSFTQESFRKFYNNWYTPERMILVVVGKVNAQEVERTIKSIFNNIPKCASPKRLPIVKVPQGNEIKAYFHHEESLTGTQIQITVLNEIDNRNYKIENFEEETLKQIGRIIINQRLRDITLNNELVLGASLSNSNKRRTINCQNLNILCQGESWSSGLSVAEQELRRVLSYGFTQAEINTAKLLIQKNYTSYRDNYSTISSRNLGDSLLELIKKNVPRTSPENLKKIIDSILERATSEKVLEAFRNSWSTQQKLISVVSNKPIIKNSQEIINSFKSSSQTPVQKPEEKRILPFAYTDLGVAASIIKQKYTEDLDIHQVTLSNNISLNIKPTGFEKNTIHININFGHGLLSLKEDNPATKLISLQALISGGLRKHSARELNNLLASKSISIRSQTTANSFQFQASTKPEDLLTQLQVLTAYFKDPAYNNNAFEQIKRNIILAQQNKGKTSGSVYNNETIKFLTNNNYTLSPPTKEQIESITISDIKEWLAPALKEQPIEISIVGDIKDIDKTIQQVCQTLGTLPTRLIDVPEFTGERKVSIQPKVQETTFRFTDKTNQAIASLIFPVEGPHNTQTQRYLNVLTQIMRSRLTKCIRDQGDGYSPEVSFSASKVFPLINRITLLNKTIAGKTDYILSEMNQIIQAEITQEELDQAKKLSETSIASSSNSNNYWLNSVLCSLTHNPKNLENALTRNKYLKNITLTEVQSLANQYLSNQEPIKIHVLPQGDDAEQ